MLKKLVTAAALAFPMVLTTMGNANEYDQSHRRPIDNFLGNWLDHTYTLKYCDSGTCTAGWSCGEQFGGGCDCSGQSDCTAPNEGWEAYGRLWGYQCADYLAGRSYGSWGVCHQATANMTYYVVGSAGNLPSVVRGWGVSTGMFGTWGTDGGAGCY